MTISQIKSKIENRMAFLVQQKRCDECLFSEGKIVSDERREEVLRECQRLNTHFICHKASINGQDVCCRGFFDEGRDARSRLASKLGLVEFITVE